jgi:hypothetical protein
MTTTDGDCIGIEDVGAIVRDLLDRRLTGMLQPIDESVQRILTGSLPRGIRSGEALAEPKADAM